MPRTCSGSLTSAACGAWACSTSRTRFEGPAAYDLVSLIQDARRDVAPEVAASVVQRYLAARPELDPEALAVAMAVLGAQRAMRILGVIARLTVTKGRAFPPV